MKNQLALIVLLLSFLVNAQDKNDVYAIVYDYPNSVQSIEILANKIKSDFTSNEDKARAVFSWIAFNVKFDVTGNSGKGFYYTNEKDRQEKNQKQIQEMVATALNNNIATASGYAFLFENLAKAVGLEVVTIPGTLKSDPSQIGQMPNGTNHLWNAVKINNKWSLLDVTLGAGYIGSNGQFKPAFNDGYFFTNPERFYLNHYPNNTEWLFVNKTKENFSKLPLFFGEYIASGYTIVSPDMGIIKPKNNIVEFKFNNLSASEPVGYITDLSSQPVVMEQDEKTLVYKASVDSKASTLIVVVKGKPVAMYLLTK
ncbi:transglutaminase domain-containing protein [Flavobacterium sp.]|uniref:transglutaminase domain-containing protein n=1 Tax=Flavobacterium sp. TaxID=239 RepID=UPI00261DA90A|nr:transglutaminase domain-containing protein [Flavobacterium sp.]